jgi:hypothetical protein
MDRKTQRRFPTRGRRRSRRAKRTRKPKRVRKGQFGGLFPLISAALFYHGATIAIAGILKKKLDSDNSEALQTWYYLWCDKKYSDKEQSGRTNIEDRDRFFAESIRFFEDEIEETKKQGGTPYPYGKLSQCCHKFKKPNENSQHILCDELEKDLNEIFDYKGFEEYWREEYDSEKFCKVSVRRDIFYAVQIVTYYHRGICRYARGVLDAKDFRSPIFMRPVIDASIHAGGQIQEWEKTAKDQFQEFIEGGIRKQENEDKLGWLREAQDMSRLVARRDQMHTSGGARVCE